MEKKLNKIKFNLRRLELAIDVSINQALAFLTDAIAKDLIIEELLSNLEEKTHSNKSEYKQEVESIAALLDFVVKKGLDNIKKDVMKLTSDQMAGDFK